MRWRIFGRNSKDRPTTQIPQTRTDYPYGLCIVTESGYFLVREKGRLRIPSERVLASWRYSTVVSSEKAVKHLPILGKLGFRDGTIVKDISDSKTYLISQNKRRHIVSPDVFDKYGLRWENVVMVSQEEINLHREGEVLN